MKPLRYGSVCSGIEAASAAWHPLGWQPVFFSEIERFPCEVLAERYGANMPGEPHARNGVPNYGDMTKFREWPDATLDLLVGGTPCQAFSIAGLRKGLDDPRGNLTLTYLAILDRYRPEWCLWGNVPGVLSIDGGRAFSAFLSGLAKLGYGWAYRVLDAQFCRVDGFAGAVPQRRRRVFVVGHSSGDPRRAAAVLFEPEGLRGDPPPRREAGEGFAHDVAQSLVSSGRGTERTGESRGQDAVIGVIASTGDVSHCLNAGGMGRIDYETETLIAGPVAASLTRGAESAGKGGYAGRRQEDDVNLVAHALRAEGFDASEDGTGRGTPLVPVAFDMRGREGGAQFEGPHDTANIRAGSGGSSRSYVAEQWAVRRLTPTECERLQGFPDGWTAITRNGKPAADGPRYKALGNSMAVNVMRWIGMRIDLARDLFGRPM